MDTATTTIDRTASATGQRSNGTAAGGPDPLDGLAGIDLPSARRLRVAWDIDIVDPEGDPKERILEANDPFTVRIRVRLRGRLWLCMAGDWYFDLGFLPLGYGQGFDLSQHLGVDKLTVKKWSGCDGRAIDLTVPVPANTIPTERCGTVYQCAGKFQLYACGKPVGVSGHEALGEYQFISPEIED